MFLFLGLVGFQAFLHNIAAVIRTGGRRLYLQKRNQLVTFADGKKVVLFRGISEV